MSTTSKIVTNIYNIGDYSYELDDIVQAPQAEFKGKLVVVTTYIYSLDKWDRIGELISTQKQINWTTSDDTN